MQIKASLSQNKSTQADLCAAICLTPMSYCWFCHVKVEIIVVSSYTGSNPGYAIKMYRCDTLFKVEECKIPSQPRANGFSIILFVKVSQRPNSF